MANDLSFFRDDLGDEETASPARDAAHPRAAVDTLALFALEAAITPAERRRIARPRSYALVVEVPSAEWVEPVREACEGLRGWPTVFARSGSSRSEDKPDRGNDKVGQRLARGAAVLGVSQACERYLPSALVAGADRRVRVAAPSNAVIARVIQAATGRRPSAMPLRVADGLSYWEICAAIRPGTARACVERLVAAVKAKSIVDATVADAPPFETLQGYGVAHEWGLRLLADLESWKEAKIPFHALDRNVVLSSSPGLGKTTYVQALAKAAKLPLIISSVSNWFTTSNGYLDGVLKQIEAVFDSAISVSPSILFLDEIDSIPNRNTMTDRAREWWTPVVTHILLIIDKINSDQDIKICIIGATNHGDRLDAALIRPGRLTRVIKIKPPTAPELAGIFRQHLGGDLPHLDLVPLGEMGLGASGAQVAGWVKEARTKARAASRPLCADDLLDVVAPPDPRSREGKFRSAVHEASHAVGVEMLGVGRVGQVDVILRADSGGGTAVASRNDLMPVRDDLERMVMSLLCGRAAEVVFLGEACGGSGGSADSDLARATALVAGIHGSLGLGSGLAWLGDMEDVARGLRGDPILRSIVEADLARIQVEAERFVGENRDLILAVAERLVARRVISGDALRALVAASRPAGKEQAGDSR